MNTEVKYTSVYFDGDGVKDLAIFEGATGLSPSEFINRVTSIVVEDAKSGSKGAEAFILGLAKMIEGYRNAKGPAKPREWSSSSDTKSIAVRLTHFDLLKERVDAVTSFISTLIRAMVGNSKELPGLIRQLTG